MSENSNPPHRPGADLLESLVLGVSHPWWEHTAQNWLISKNLPEDQSAVFDECTIELQQIHSDLQKISDKLNAAGFNIRVILKPILIV